MSDDARMRLATYLDGLAYEARKPVAILTAHGHAITNMAHDRAPTEAALAMADELLHTLGIVAVPPELVERWRAAEAAAKAVEAKGYPAWHATEGQELVDARNAIRDAVLEQIGGGR